MESLLFLAEKALDSKDFSNDFDVECLILARSKLISLCNCKFGGDISSEFNNLLSNNDEESFSLLDYLVRRCSSKPTVFSLVSDNLDTVLSIYDRHLSAELSRFVTAILREIVREDYGNKYHLMLGRTIKIKRKQFEEFINNVEQI